MQIAIARALDALQRLRIIPSANVNFVGFNRASLLHLRQRLAENLVEYTRGLQNDPQNANDERERRRAHTHAEVHLW